VDTRNHIDFVCNNYILNWLDNTLYDMSINSTKLLQKVLDKKYKAGNIDIKKFIKITCMSGEEPNEIFR